MTAIATLALQQATLANIHRSQNSFVTLNEQLSSGVKSRDLADYRPADQGRLLDLRAETSRRTGYVKAIDLASPRLDAYNATLGRMGGIAKDIAGALAGQASYDAADKVALGTQIDNALNELTSLMNERLGDRYLYAGRNYDTAPVADLRSLGPVALPVPPATARVTAPDLPPYHSGAQPLPAADQAAWTTDRVAVADGRGVDAGLTANDPALQDLVQGLRLARAALDQAAAAPDAASADAAYQSYSAAARGTLTAAQDGIRALSARIATDQKAFSAARDLHQSAINLLGNAEEGITGVDPADIAVRLTAVQTQLEATYRVTASLANLSLVKFL